MIVFHKYNLIISFLVDLRHSDKSSCDILHEYVPLWGNLSREIISIIHNHYSWI